MRRTLQRQEEAREAALKAFHDNIAARAVVAGTTVVAESRARQELEDRLVAASTAKANADAEVSSMSRGGFLTSTPGGGVALRIPRRPASVSQ